MPLAAVVAATCLCAAFGSVMMGAFARYPIALAPGMGLNAYFTYTVVKAMSRTVADRARRRVSLRHRVSGADGGGRPADDRVGDPARAVRGGGGWDRTVHRAHRIAQRRHHRRQPGDAGHDGESAAARHAAGDRGTAVDRGAVRVESPRRDFARDSGYHGAGDRVRAGALAAAELFVSRHHGHRDAPEHARRGELRAGGDRVRVPVRGSVRQHRHAGGGGEAGQAVRQVESRFRASTASCTPTPRRRLWDRWRAHRR